MSTLISFYDVQITQKHPNIIYYIFFKPYSPSQHKAKFALFYPLRCFIDHFAADNYTQCDMFIVDVRKAFVCVFVCMLESFVDWNMNTNKFFGLKLKKN